MKIRPHKLETVNAIIILFGSRIQHAVIEYKRGAQWQLT